MSIIFVKAFVGIINQINNKQTENAYQSKHFEILVDIFMEKKMFVNKNSYILIYHHRSIKKDTNSA